MPRFRFDGEELQRRRKALGVRAERVCADADVSLHSLTSYELGRVVPSTPVVLRLAEALGCKPGDLFSPDAVERLIDQRAEQGMATVPTDSEVADAVELLGQAQE
jgi:transcriptional regulator with XRE-family HTH domain